MTARVTVVGAGVVGLTCAVRLAEAGERVDVLARELPLETSSAAGGGLAVPPVRGAADQRWIRTRDALHALAADDGTGVSLRSGRLIGPDGTRREILPLADLDVYLPYLVGRLEAAGGTLTRLALASLPERGVVVNCTGVAARALAPDPELRPGRAQILRLADPGLDGWWLDTTPGRECFVLPHGRHVVVGGPVTEGDWSPTPERETAELLAERAAALVPELRGARVLGHRVGLRPLRHAVRLDRVREGDRTVVHCYGHGADALALSWGCADDVLALAAEAAHAAGA